MIIKRPNRRALKTDQNAKFLRLFPAFLAALLISITACRTNDRSDFIDPSNKKSYTVQIIEVQNIQRGFTPLNDPTKLKNSDNCNVKQYADQVLSIEKETTLDQTLNHPYRHATVQKGKTIIEDRSIPVGLKIHLHLKINEKNNLTLHLHYIYQFVFGTETKKLSNGDEATYPVIRTTEYTTMISEKAAANWSQLKDPTKDKIIFIRMLPTPEK